MYHYEQLLNSAASQLDTLPLQKADAQPTVLKKAFDLVYDLGIFALYRYDPALHEQIKFRLFQTLTSRSGSLAFLAIQILAANKIMHNSTFSQKERYFAKKCGIAINHLRAPVTVVSAVKRENTYLLNGTMSWASGYGIFDTLVAGFHCDGKEFQAVVPFVPQPGFAIGEGVETFVGNAMQTVNITLTDYVVPHDAIVVSRPMGTYTQNKSVSKTIHYALYGIGLGALKLIADTEVKTAAHQRLEKLKNAFLKTMDGSELDALRVALFSLVQQTVTTAMVLTGGGSVRSCETLQRYYREIIMFNANGLNDALKERFKKEYLS